MCVSVYVGQCVWMNERECVCGGMRDNVYICMCENVCECVSVCVCVCECM